MNQIISRAPKVDFSGRVLVQVCPYAMGADPLIEKAHGTYALCSSALRCAARCGDIIICVSPPQSTSRSRGLETKERVLLSMGLVESMMPVPTYHGLAAPAWAKGRADRVYRATAPQGSRNTRQGRLIKASLKQATYRRVMVSREQVCEEGPGSWKADYGNRCVRFVMRAKMRYHNLEGLNRIPPEDRHRDFSGRVLVSQLCKTYASSGTDMMPLPRCLQNAVSFGQGFRKTEAPQGSALRKFIVSELGQHI